MIRYPGQYYTQAQCKELEAYAAERGVTIIPEIDMPGHSDVFTKAMGFTMQTDKGIAALRIFLMRWLTPSLWLLTFILVAMRLHLMMVFWRA